MIERNTLPHPGARRGSFGQQTRCTARVKRSVIQHFPLRSRSGSAGGVSSPRSRPTRRSSAAPATNHVSNSGLGSTQDTTMPGGAEACFRISGARVDGQSRSASSTMNSARRSAAAPCCSLAHASFTHRSNSLCLTDDALDGGGTGCKQLRTRRPDRRQQDNGRAANVPPRSFDERRKSSFVAVPFNDGCEQKLDHCASVSSSANSSNCCGHPESDGSGVS